MNEQEQFLKDTEVDPNKVDVLEQPLIPETPAKGDEGTEGGTDEGTDGDDDEGKDGKPRNRRERRLTAKLQAERESSMFLAGKLEARTEASKAITEEADYLKAVERIYGMDTPEAQLATDLLKKAIVGAREDAKREAITEVREERKREANEQRAAEKELDDMVDEIEDEFGITLTDTQERAFFQLLEKMSPKNDDGSVREYADSHAVWEVFQEKLRKPTGTTSQAKNMSSRSMTQSGASKESNLQNDVTARFLQDSGII